MMEKFLNIFKIPDLRKKLIFTGLLLLVYRLGGKVPIPGIAPQLGINGRLFTIMGAVTEIDEDGQGKIQDDSNPRISVGFGVEWKSPFGPVRVDMAHAALKEDYDRTQFIKFNFGTRF